MMRPITMLLFGCSALLFSCGASKKPTAKSGEKMEVTSMENGSVKGTAMVTDRFKEGTCNFLILTSKDGEEVILHPANLSDEFKKNDLKVKIQYRQTRQPNTDGCNKGLFVQIEEISAL